MNASPEFSVLMASYQRAHLIQRAVRSLGAQSHRDWELLVADDGSTDNTPAVLARLGRSEPRLPHDCAHQMWLEQRRCPYSRDHVSGLTAQRSA